MNDNYKEIYSGKPGYKTSPTCKVCNAKGWTKEPLRDMIDEFGITNTGTSVVAKLKENGVLVTEQAVMRHFHKHAPYVIQAKADGSKKIQKMVVKISQTKVEVGEALQRILDIGDQRVKDGDLPVTERLYIEAIKEQGRRGTRTTLDTEFETMDGDFVNKIKALNGGQTN